MVDRVSPIPKPFMVDSGYLNLLCPETLKGTIKLKVILLSIFCLHTPEGYIVETIYILIILKAKYFPQAVHRTVLFDATLRQPKTNNIG